MTVTSVTRRQLTLPKRAWVRTRIFILIIWDAVRVKSRKGVTKTAETLKRMNSQCTKWYFRIEILFQPRLRQAIEIRGQKSTKCRHGWKKKQSLKQSPVSSKIEIKINSWVEVRRRGRSCCKTTGGERLDQIICKVILYLVRHNFCPDSIEYLTQLA